MSALWVLGLGASIGYLAFKRQKIEDRLDLAIKEWDGSGAKESEPAPPDGANFNEIKKAWKHTADTRTSDFHERCPPSEQARLLKLEEQRAKEVQQFDGQHPNIEGVFLEQIGSS